MFDANDFESIGNAPQLSELSPSQISRMITQAAVFVKASVNNVALNAGPPEMQLQLNRLARTMEALVSVRPERENIRSAAFVAALAHRALREWYGESWIFPALTTESVSPALATALLFAIGGSPGDAQALGKELNGSSTPGISGMASRLVASLIVGDLVGIIDAEAPEFPVEIDLDNAAEFQLYKDLIDFTISIAQRYSPSTQKRYWPVTIEMLKEKARRIKRATYYEFDILADEHPSRAIHVSSTYPGIAHLAGLLAILVDVLEESAVTVNWPEQNFAELGMESQLSVMTKRPFLWPNHIGALKRGFLNSQTSAVVTYPTGSGKSTLIEMRIGLGLDEGKSALVLAPTNSLVDQTKRNLSELFPGAILEDAQTEGEAPGIYVLTPEKYLIIRANLHANVNIGLLIFDEFHLMHSMSGGQGRRSLDSMLSVVLFLRDAPDASIILLSALVKNGSQLARWIAAITGRECLNLNDTWRPNRQLRGMVAYESQELSIVSQKLWEVRRRRANPVAPKEAKDVATATPYAIFGVQRTWTGDVDDLIFSKIIDHPVPLGLGTQNNKSRLWHYTANANAVAAAIVSGVAFGEAKSIVFAQTIPWAHSIAKRLHANFPQSFGIPTAYESVWLEDLILEFGSKDSLYVSLNDDRHFNRAAVSHHGLLLVQERLLHESLYKRDDGVDTLVATSTIAQGMNMPADLVVIAGDSRYDEQASEYSRIGAPDLLNAAGRAGRAGTSDTGTVLIIPSQPLQFQGATVPDLTARLFARIYSEDDASLILEDPFTKLLSPDSEDDSAHLLAYVAGRISGAYQATDYGAAESVESVLGVIKLSFSAQSRNDSELAGDLMSVAERLRSLNVSTPSDVSSLPEEIVEVAAANGVNAESLASLMNSLGTRHPGESLADTLGRIRASLDAIDRPEDLLPPWLHVGEVQESSESDGEGRTEGTEHLFRETEWEALSAWIAGRPVQDIESILIVETKRRTTECREARRFVLRRVADFAFIVSLPALVWRRQLVQEPDAVLDKLELLVREGFDVPGKLDLWEAEGRSRMRVWCHNRFAEYDPWSDL